MAATITGGPTVKGGPIGAPGLQGISTEYECLQSASLSKKQKKLFKISEIETNPSLCKFTYRGTNFLHELEIVRIAIRCSQIVGHTVTEENLFPLERDIFKIAKDILERTVPAEDAIAGLRVPGITGLFPNNVVLVDIFESVKSESPNRFEISLNDSGHVKTHTICLWRKTKGQYMIIDPSSSKFIERLRGSLESCLRADEPNSPDSNASLLSSSSSSASSSPPSQKWSIVEYPKKKFYSLPKNPNVDEKSENDEKFRDCIDIALKIAIVLNEGVLLYKNVCEIQHSINLLSNQSLVNPVLGKLDENTCIKHLQSTRLARRFSAISAFSSIPILFKRYFSFGDWLEFAALNDEKQNSILKALTIFEREIERDKFFPIKERTASVLFDRLERLSKLCDPFESLKKDAHGGGSKPDCEISVKLTSLSFGAASQ